MSSSSLTMPMIILLYNTQSCSLLIWFEMILILAVKFPEAESSLHSIEPLISGLNIFFRSHYCPIVLKTLLALEGLWHLISMILKTLQHGSYSVAYDNNAISLFFIGLELALYFVLEAIYRRLSRDQNRTQTLEDGNATLQTSLKEE